MADVEVTLERGDKPLIAITTVGITTQGAMTAPRVLEAADTKPLYFMPSAPAGAPWNRARTDCLF